MRKQPTTKTRTPATSLDWLMAQNTKGEPRIRTLSWGRLARIYHAKMATPAVREAIKREARRCGYQPSTILHLNKWA